MFCRCLFQAIVVIFIAYRTIFTPSDTICVSRFSELPLVGQKSRWPAVSRSGVAPVSVYDRRRRSCCIWQRNVHTR